MVSRQRSSGAISLFFLCFGGEFNSFKVTREQHPSLIETVVIPPVSRKEVNFKHVSRQERRKKMFLGPELEVWEVYALWLLRVFVLIREAYLSYVHTAGLYAQFRVFAEIGFIYLFFYGMAVHIKI